MKNSLGAVPEDIGSSSTRKHEREARSSFLPAFPANEVEGSLEGQMG